MGILEEGQQAPTREELEAQRVRHENEQAAERALHQEKRSSGNDPVDVKENEQDAERQLHRDKRRSPDRQD
jgi:hypothetical protein